ncbi:MAG: type IV secretory system conjugative DNA transfer family protein [Stenomitos frigidus ULC029]
MSKSGKSDSFPPAPELGSIPKKTPVELKGDSKTIWIPDTQRSVMVVGAPGSGKTFSAIDPMIRSVIEQGYPICLYDFKYPTQTSAVAWYAEQLGYKIHVFAPGFPESDILNLLDFLTGDPNQDSALARQLANTMNKNFKIGASSGGDPFFDSAGDQLVQAVMMLTKQMKHSDVLMTSVILSAPQLIERLYPESSGIDPWIRQAFGQIFSVKESEKTVSSIVGTAALNFGKLVMPKILAACIGKTTLPLDLDGKVMVVFGLDRELRDVMGPIVATAIHMLVNQNLFRKKGQVASDGSIRQKDGRNDPLFVVLDELPTVYLPQLPNWENESRSDGFNGIIGFQNKSQLKKIYGEEMSLAIMGGAATKFIFNPGEVESAEYFSKFFGDEEISRKNKSKSIGGGKPSTSHSVEVGVRKLVSPEEFIMLPPGTCVMTNPAYANKEMSYLPRRINFKIPQAEIELAGMIESRWNGVETRLQKRSSGHFRMPTQEDVNARVAEFDERFPIPVEGEEAAAPPPVDVLAGLFS